MAHFSIGLIWGDSDEHSSHHGAVPPAKSAAMSPRMYSSVMGAIGKGQSDEDTAYQ